MIQENFQMNDMNSINEAWEKYSKSKSEENLEVLILSASPIILKHTKGWANSPSLFPFGKDDIIEEGYLGFFNAIRLYKKKNGAKFSTFAFLKITGQIMDAMRSWRRKRGIREYIVNDNGKVLRTNGRDAPKNNHEHKEFHYPKCFRADEMEKFVHNEHCFFKKLHTTNFDILDIDNKDYANYIFNNISEKNKTFLKLRFYENKTYAEIGKMFNISNTRVWQIINATIEEIKIFLTKKGEMLENI